MAKRFRAPRDLTVVAIPIYFGTIAVEHLWLRRRAARQGGTAGDYERSDTIASLSMGVGSLVVPLVTARLLRPFTPGRGRLGKAVIGVAAAAAALTTVADVVVRRLDEDPPPEASPSASTTGRDVARKVAAVGGVTTVVCGGVAMATFWSSRTALERFWRRRFLPSLGTGPLALAAAVAGWDFIYYWNHRFMHQSRYMWALHVVHHSSEHYNLSTALRQPVADSLNVAVPYGALCLVGIPPDLVMRARDLNLLYQYWIHTETIGRLGPAEAVLNTPSHHRVHHGSNRLYLDRNHGSIL
ncbi:MAG: sterol desaturase family protein, partial [Acidimicrobiales bacterium]|nr:sterol desaturase family protein [Acidimicrobiales bacterium]